MNILDTWQLNLFLYLIFVVIFYQGYKLAVKDAKEDGAATILLQFIAGISILLASVFFKFSFPTDIKFYLLLGLACIFYAINDRLQTTARKNLEVSTFSIINQLSTVILILYGLFIFKDAFLPLKILGGVFIVAGNCLIIYKKGKFSFNKYIVFSLIATTAFATAISIDVGISNQFNLPFYITLTLLIPAIMVIILERISLKSIVYELQSKSRKYYFITGFAWGLTILFALRSYQFGSVTLIAPLQATSIIINIILAYFIHKEKDNIQNKIIAGILVFIGILFTVLV